MGDRPDARALRKHFARCQMMAEDPALTGDLLLVGLALAVAVDLRGGDVSLPHIARQAFGDTHPHRVHDILRGDIRRYRVRDDYDATCQAPMIRRPGTCDSPVTRSRGVMLRDPHTGETWRQYACTRPEHAAWLAALALRNLDEAAAAPTPPANIGGVLARHLPEVSWPPLWKALDPTWEPWPEPDPPSGGGRTLTLLDGEVPDDAPTGRSDGIAPLMLIEGDPDQEPTG